MSVAVRLCGRVRHRIHTAAVVYRAYWVVARHCRRQWGRETTSTAPSSGAGPTAAALPEPTVVRGSRRLAARESDAVWRLMNGDVLDHLLAQPAEAPHYTG